MASDSMAILIILTLPIYKHEMYFHLFVFNFSEGSKFSLYRAFISLDKFTSEHFGFFYYCEWKFYFRCFVISEKECNWFLYVDFVSCHLNEINSKGFFLTLGFFIFKIISSANSDNFTFSFLIWCLFFVFPNCCS